MAPRNLRILPVVLVFLIGCEKFEYSPYQLFPSDGEMPEDLNAYNISRIQENEASADDTVRFVYTGDSQRQYDRLEDLVRKVNALKNVDFLVICGDIADFGLLQEYMWIHQRLEQLNIPYLCVIGNHDFAANQGIIYERMYGPRDFSMTYKNYRFVFHDTNSREHNFNGSIPDLAWLDQTVNPGRAEEWVVAMGHVPPYDKDFDPALETEYAAILATNPNTLLALYGHRHSHSDHFPYQDHVRYMTSNSVEKDEFVLIELVQGEVSKKLIGY